MTISHETIDAMVAAGASAEVIAAAWKAELQGAQKKIEEKRANARERKRKSRHQKMVSHMMSHDVTVTERDNVGQAVTKKSPPLPPSLSPAPQTLPPISPQKNSGGDRFEDFWQAFPKKTGLGAARSAFTNEIFLKSADPFQIVRAAQNFADKIRREGTEERFVQNPAKWLESQCYLDPDLQAEPSKPLDRTGWDAWHILAADLLGDAVVRSWLLKAEREGSVIYLPTKQAQYWVRDHYGLELKKLGIEEFGILKTSTTGADHDRVDA